MIRFSSYIFFIIFIIFQANAQINHLSVKEAVNIALDKNPDLIKKQNDIDIARKNVFINNTLSKPELIYMKEGIDGGDFSEERFSVNQAIDFPLKIFKNISADKTIVNAAELEYETLKKDIICEVKTAYSDLAFALELINLRTKQVAVLDSLNKVTFYKLEAGVATEMDLMKSEILLQQAKNELSDANVELHTARYALFTKIGLDPDNQTYNISFPDSLHFEKIDVNQKFVLGKIYDYPQYIAESEKEKYFVKRKTSAYYDLFPDFNLSYYKQDYGNGYNYFGYEAGFSVPLWFFTDQSKKIQKMEISKISAQTEQNKVVLNLKKEIEYAWHGFDQSKKKIIIFKNDILPKSQKLLDLNLIGYREGQIELLQFLDTQKLYLENEIQYFKELRNYYHKLITLEKFLDEELIFKTK